MWRTIGTLLFSRAVAVKGSETRGLRGWKKKKKAEPQSQRVLTAANRDGLRRTEPQESLQRRAGRWETSWISIRAVWVSPLKQDLRTQVRALFKSLPIHVHPHWSVRTCRISCRLTLRYFPSLYLLPRHRRRLFWETGQRWMKKINTHKKKSHPSLFPLWVIESDFFIFWSVKVPIPPTSCSAASLWRRQTEQIHQEKAPSFSGDASFSAPADMADNNSVPWQVWLPSQRCCQAAGLKYGCWYRAVS